ncbi:MAG: DUF502 domain-containing protein [Alcanivoracaceae bacterium]|nr:DUF502 domain-containing protein [Alcanivoracaceae bacterium]
MTEVPQSRFSMIVRRSLAGGLLILLPMVIVGTIFSWIYDAASGLISPFTGPVIATFGLPKVLADLTVVALLILLCFLIGTLVATRLGAWLWLRVEEVLMVRVPGYRSVREITAQLLGNSNDSPFKRGEVARVWLYGRQVEVSVLGLVTSRHEDGRVSVFVPTGPNPTTGFIYHVSTDLVEFHPEIRVEQMMKSVIACGAGTSALIGQLPR